MLVVTLRSGPAGKWAVSPAWWFRYTEGSQALLQQGGRADKLVVLTKHRVVCVCAHAQ